MCDLLIKNGLLLDISNNTANPYEILIQNRRITEINHKINFQSPTLEVLDAKEGYIMPGMIDCHTHLGIIEEATGKIGVDNNETSNPVTPHLRGIDAINPWDIAFGDAVRSGVTSVMSGPGSNNAVGGLSTAIKTHGTIIDNMIIQNPIGLKIALGENPISTYGISDKTPVTRMGTAALIRELFMQAEDYMYQKEQNSLKERNIKLEAVIPLLKGEISLRTHAHRADDIITAIRIADEFKIKRLVIEHGTEANLVKDYLKERNIPVAFGPMLTPRIKMELKNRRYGSVIELVEAGIKVSLITDHPYNSIDQLRTICALAVSEGLSPIDALKCVTVHAAEILHCENRIGKIEKGYDADIVIYNDHPLNINSNVLFTIINGKVVYKRN